MICSTNTVLPINGNGKELCTIANTLYFQDYQLDVYNPISIFPTGKQLNELIRQKVVATDERQEEAEIIFDDGYKMLVYMRNEAYYGPEAIDVNIEYNQRTCIIRLKAVQFLRGKYSATHLL